MEPKYIFAVCQKRIAGEPLYAVASTGVIDRADEVIDPGAWDGTLKVYRDNPVMLACHQHRLITGSSPVIGSAPDMDVVNRELGFHPLFAGTPLGREYGQLYDEGHMRAFSVGFIPKKGETRDIGGKRIYVHTEVELLEVSAVPVPANPEALARARAAALALGAADPEAVQSEIRNLKSELEARFKALETAFKAAFMDGLDELKCLMPDYVNPREPGPAAAPGADGEDAGDGDKRGKSAAAARAAAGEVHGAAERLLATLKQGA